MGFVIFLSAILALIISSKILDLLKLYERVNSVEEAKRVDFIYMVLAHALFIAIALALLYYLGIDDYDPTG